MPEGPEVEVLRREIEPELVGLQVVKIDRSNKALRFDVSYDEMNQLSQKTIKAVTRVGKVLIWRFNTAEELHFMLGMTGRFDWRYSDTAAEKHEHICFTLKKAQSVVHEQLVFVDPRRFGGWRYFARPTRPSVGVDGFGEQRCDLGWIDRLVASSRALKELLLDQTLVAGIGNIYASEICFQLGIHPALPGHQVPNSMLERLIPMIDAVLFDAASRGGSTLKDYRTPRGRIGRFPELAGVYGRAGSPCPRCQQSEIKRIFIGQRASFFCPQCQVMP